MADFCQQCSLEAFDKDTKDFAGLSNAVHTKNGLYAVVLCESCGPCQVDHNGKCITHDAEHHKSLWREPEPDDERELEE